MRRGAIEFAALALTWLGCAGDDGFRARLAQGCRTEAECAQLEVMAKSRVHECASADECGAAVQDLEVARSYLDVLTRERMAREAAARQAFEAEQQQKRFEAERQGQLEAERQRQQIEAERQRFEAEQQRQAEQKRREAEALARQQEEQRAAEEEAQREAEEKASRANAQKKARPAVSEGRVCCCDGSVSPTCTYVHRGCCSHHGGVCECE